MQNMQTAMQAMDVALKQTVSLRDETKVFARAIFWRDETKSRSLGDGAEVISSSLRNMSFASWSSFFHLSVDWGLQAVLYTSVMLSNKAAKMD